MGRRAILLVLLFLGLSSADVFFESEDNGEMNLADDNPEAEFDANGFDQEAESDPNGFDFVDDGSDGQSENTKDSKMVRKILQNPQLLAELKTKLLHCYCRAYYCRCCHSIFLWRYHYRSSACITVQHRVHSRTMVVRVTIGGSTLYYHRVSAIHPGAICLSHWRYPHVSVCAHFSGLILNYYYFYGCASIDIRLFSYSILRAGLGCFRMVSFNSTTSAIGDPFPSGESLPEKQQYMEETPMQVGATKVFKNLFGEMPEPTFYEDDGKMKK